MSGARDVKTSLERQAISTNELEPHRRGDHDNERIVLRFTELSNNVIELEWTVYPRGKDFQGVRSNAFQMTIRVFRFESITKFTSG